MTKLKTLEKHNTERRASYRHTTEIRGNGIACPECGMELWDSNPHDLLLSYPPMMNVRCPACDYREYRMA